VRPTYLVLLCGVVLVRGGAVGALIQQPTGRGAHRGAGGGAGGRGRGLATTTLEEGRREGGGELVEGRRERGREEVCIHRGPYNLAAFVRDVAVPLCMNLQEPRLIVPVRGCVRRGWARGGGGLFAPPPEPRPLRPRGGPRRRWGPRGTGPPGTRSPLAERQEQGELEREEGEMGDRPYYMKTGVSACLNTWIWILDCLGV
jgi:hypothetical protein